MPTWIMSIAISLTHQPSSNSSTTSSNRYWIKLKPPQLLVIDKQCQTRMSLKGSCRNRKARLWMMLIKTMWRWRVFWQLTQISPIKTARPHCQQSKCRYQTRTYSRRTTKTLEVCSQLIQFIKKHLIDKVFWTTWIRWSSSCRIKSKSMRSKSWRLRNRCSTT